MTPVVWTLCTTFNIAFLPFVCATSLSSLGCLFPCTLPCVSSSEESRIVRCPLQDSMWDCMVEVNERSGYVGHGRWRSARCQSTIECVRTTIDNNNNDNNPGSDNNNDLGEPSQRERWRAEDICRSASAIFVLFVFFVLLSDSHPAPPSSFIYLLAVSRRHTPVVASSQ